MNTQIESIRTMLADELAKWDQPSIAVGIIKDGEVVLHEAFGMADAPAGRPANDETMYQIGSCSKAFTAAAVAILVDQGKLEWDTPVKKYMPWIEFQDPFTTDHVTVRDLLCHRTGLPRHDAYWIDGPCTRKEMVENLRNMQPCWSFRSQWCYQNTCYVAAGMLIEIVTGKTWEEFVDEAIFQPLGMTRSTFYVDAIQNDPNHAEPHERHMPTDTNGYELTSFLKSDREDMAAGIGAPYGPAGSIMSTVNDMMKWVALHLNNGKVGETQLISESSMTELHKPQMLMSEPLLIPFPEQDFFSYAMGWFTESYRGHKMVEHGGNINGFSALVTMIPDLNLGIVTLTNFDNSFDTYASTYSIIDTYLGIADGDWHNRWREIIAQLFSSLPEQLKAMNGEPVPGTSPSHPIDDYVGTYVNPTYGELTIGKDEKGLTFCYNKAGSPLEHFHYDAFQITNPKHLYAGVNIFFGTDKFGKISTVTFDAVMNPAAKAEVFTKKA